VLVSTAVKPRLVTALDPTALTEPATQAESVAKSTDSNAGGIGDTGNTSRGGGAASAAAGAQAARMLKVADAELVKMRRASPDSYRELTRHYLQSLDPVGQRLLLDVQRRIQPTHFDEQLRQRLVRFMVENPGAWRTAETTSLRV